MGVERVFLPGPELSQAAPIALDEVFSIAGTAFFRIQDIATDHSGRIYVLERAAMTVSVFDREGSLVQKFGGEGEGPGEFRERPNAVFVSGSHVVVLEQRYCHAFTTDGRSVASRALDVSTNLVVPAVGGSDSVWMLVKHQRGAADRGLAVSEGTQTARDTLRVHELSMDCSGFSPDPILEIPGPQRWFIPFSYTRWLAGTPRFAIARTGEIFVSHASDYHIDVYDSSGTLVRQIHADVSRIRVDGEMRAAAFDRDVRNADSLGVVQALVFAEYGDEILALGHVDQRPVIGSMLVNDAGLLLVERADLDPDPHELAVQDSTYWDLIDQREGRIGTFVVPPNIEVMHLSEDRIYAVAKDEFDVESVVAFQLPRR